MIHNVRIVHLICLHHTTPLHRTRIQQFGMGNEMILVFHASLAFMLAIRFGTAERKILVVSLLMLLHLLIITRMVLAPIDSADSILARQHARLQFVIRRELVAVIEIIVVALVSKVIQPTVDVRYHRLGRTLLRLVASTIGSLITRVVIDLGFQLDELKLWIVVSQRRSSGTPYP